MRLIAKHKQSIIEVCTHLRVADNFWSRFWGLMREKTLPMDEGLWIIPCPSIHTFFMKFPIDAVFINKQKTIVDLRSNVSPFRFVWPSFQAHSVIELPNGAIRHKDLKVGMELEVQ